MKIVLLLPPYRRVLHFLFFFSSRRRHTRSLRDWSSDVCSSDLPRQNCLCGAGRLAICVTFLLAEERFRKNYLRRNRMKKISVRAANGNYDVLCGRRSEERRVGKESRTQ